MSNPAQERRRYFRVNDTLDLAYRILETNEDVTQSRQQGRLRSGQWLTLENEIQIALEKVRMRSTELADLLTLFNQKINMLDVSDDAEHGEASLHKQSSASVNISACGIAFKTTESIEVGRRLELKLRLYPNMVEMSVVAMVIACEAPVESAEESEDCEGWLIRADFTGMDDDLQELLIQHVLKCQTRELKLRREAERPD